MLMISNHSSFSLSVPLAQVDHQRVVQDLLLLVVLKVVEVAALESEVALDVLADRDGALLPVDDFVVASSLFDPALSPVHDVEREALA